MVEKVEDCKHRVGDSCTELWEEGKVVCGVTDPANCDSYASNKSNKSNRGEKSKCQHPKERRKKKRQKTR